MSVLNHPLIAARYFFPQRVPLPGATWVETPAGPLSCWRSAPPSTRPLLVHFHGNGELVHHWIDGFAPVIEAMGFDVFLAEYRGYGASAGEPLLGEMLGDLDAIHEALGVADADTVVFGRSVGSIFAIEWVKRYPETRGLILESGIFDVLERLALRVTPGELGCTQEALEAACREHLDHGAKLRGYAGPSLILHARGDHLVDHTHAQRNAEAAGARARLVTFPHGDHNSIMAANAEDYFAEIGAFLRS